MHLYFVCQGKNWDVPASEGHDSKVRSKLPIIVD